MTIAAGDITSVGVGDLAGAVYVVGGNSGTNGTPGRILLQPGNDGNGNYANVNVIANASLSVDGSKGFLISVSSVLGSGFFGTSMQLSGSSIVGSTLTVQGNAFSVGGSTFIVVGTSVGIRTAAPAAALDVNGSAQFGSGAAKSTFTAAGLLKLAASGIQFSDGTAQTTAPRAVLRSSYVFLNGNASPTSQTGFNGRCISGSTVTYTALGSTVAVVMNATWRQDCVNGRVWQWGYLQDGKIPSPMTNTTGLVGSYDQGYQGYDRTATFRHVLQTTTGEHGYCLMVLENVGSGCTLTFTSGVASAFGVEEVY